MNVESDCSYLVYDSYANAVPKLKTIVSMDYFNFLHCEDFGANHCVYVLLPDELKIKTTLLHSSNFISYIKWHNFRPSKLTIINLNCQASNDIVNKQCVQRAIDRYVMHTSDNSTH